MDVVRILVVQENADPSRELRLTAFHQPVEFSFTGPDPIIRREADLSPFVAIVATLDCDHRALIDSLREGPENGPPLFLFRNEPPFREIARWVTWARTQDDNDPAVTMRLLSESMEYYSLASLYQRCLKIMECQDEEKLLSHIADTFTHEIDAEGCVIWLVSPLDPDEMLIASVRGLISIDREGPRFSLSQNEWTKVIGKGKPFFLQGDEYQEAGGERPVAETSLYLPLMHREKPIGLVKLAPTADRKSFGDRDVYIASIIAGYAASAWKHVTRLVRMEKVTVRDVETRAYSPAFLSDYYEKERFKAARFRRPLSVVFIIIDNFSHVMKQTRETLVVGALSEMVDAFRKALRESDLIARVEPNRFCIVLPETDYFGSLLASRRLRKTARESRPIQYLGADYALEPSIVSVTFPRDGKELSDLWRAAEEKYRSRKQSALHRMRLPEKDLWTAFDAMVGDPEYYDLLRSGISVSYFSRFKRNMGRNGHFCLRRETYQRMVESVAKEIRNLNRERGLVIAAGPRPETFKQIFLSQGLDSENGGKIYIIGRGGSTRLDSKNLMYVNAEDDSLRDREILLFLREHSGYGLFSTEREDEVCGFNTAEEWLVDSMMEKVQETYRLQGSF